MYYKIVTSESCFTKLVDELRDNKIDALNIPNGTIFTAPGSDKYTTQHDDCFIAKSLLHFASGAFDTMLWHTKLSHHNTIECQIYTVQPIGRVIKERCPDSNGIYQCGAHKIKILEKQNIDKMYELALREYKTNHTKYTNFTINLNWWKKHEPTVFIINESYRDSLPKKTYPPIPLDRLLDLVKEL